MKKKLQGLVAAFTAVVLAGCSAARLEPDAMHKSETPRGRYLVYLGGENNAGSLWMFDYPSNRVCEKMFNIKVFNAATNHERMNPVFKPEECRPFKTIRSRAQKKAALRGAVEVAEGAGESQIYVEIPGDREEPGARFDRSKRMPRL